MIRNSKYIDDMTYLETRGGSKRAKYRRNLRAYYHTFGYGMTNIDDTAVAGYYSSSATDIEEDTSSGIQENIIKSTIDTLVSKIASQKVRPFFNTVNGTFKDMQIVKQAQQFFDSLYDDQNVNRTVADSFKDSCIFDTGVIYVDSDSKKIIRVMPWQINFDSKEASYNGLTRVLWKMDNYPVTLLPFKSKNINNMQQSVTYYRYYNLNDNNGKKTITLENSCKTKELVNPTVDITYEFTTDTLKYNANVVDINRMLNDQKEAYDDD